MARYTEAVCRQCRREGQKLFLKGDRCYTQKCALECRGYAPGQHGQGRSKTSEYGSQLREKQKVRRYYGVLEKQFRSYFAMAEKRQGITGENLLAILETRLNIPSFLVKPGMVITLKDSSKSLDKIKANVEANASRPAPKWLDYDANNMVGKVVAIPARDDIDLPVEEHLIVELYSK